SPSSLSESKFRKWASQRPHTAELWTQMPSPEVIDYCIKVYFNSIHWFMVVVHEGRITTKYATLFEAYELDRLSMPDSDEDFTFVLLLMMIVVMGAKCALMHPVRRRKLLTLMSCSEESVENTMASLISIIRSHLLDALSVCTLETVQTCILLGSFYLYHGDPNIAWSILGCAYKAIQALSLNKEKQWIKSSGITDPSLNEITQLRRRIFWALYISDRFSAMAYGRPLEIQDEMCDIGLPNDITTYPVFGSPSYLPDGPSDEPTLLTYQVYKVEFYVILGEIIANLYTSPSLGCSALVQKYNSQNRPSSRASMISNASMSSPTSHAELRNSVEELEAKLRAWYVAVPDALKLDAVLDNAPEDLSMNPDMDDGDDFLVSPDESSDEAKEQFRRNVLGVEALVLQLGYDNALIMLHRPFLATDAQSAEKCWNAALRMSRVSSHPGLFAGIQASHAVSFVCLHLFTAGVVLSYFGCREPLSVRALESKQAMGRILRMQKALSGNALVADRGHEILENLTRALVEKEMDRILT
ncbi:fungal-specific transcription factor domain-containing protein, partial [Dipodascopsis uninucleata]